MEGREGAKAEGGVSLLKKPLSDDHGVVLVFSFFVLVILSLMAAFAASISNIETLTSTNNEKFQTAFLIGEGVTVESVGLLKNTSYDEMISHSPTLVGDYENWLDKYNGVGYFEDEGGPDLTDPDNWDQSGDATTFTGFTQSMDKGGFLPPGFDSTADRIMFAVQDAGIATRESADTSSGEQVRAYHLFGLYDVGRNAAFPGMDIMEMGFKMRLVHSYQMPSNF